MFVLISIFMIILSLLLIGVILLQPGKGDMISGMSGLGGTFSNMLGSRRATDLLSKITIGLATVIILLTVVTNKFFVGAEQKVQDLLPEGVVVPKQYLHHPSKQIYLYTEPVKTGDAPAEKQPEKK